MIYSILLSLNRKWITGLRRQMAGSLPGWRLAGMLLFSGLFVTAFTGLPGVYEAPAVRADLAGSGWSVWPPLVAIVVALLFRQVLPALFLGVWMGAWLMAGMGASGLVSSFFATATAYIVPSIADPDHVSIIVFGLFTGGMVGVIGANGGTRGVLRAIAGLVTTRRRAQVTTTAMGYVVFFDDYANTMVVGTTMRPLTDRLRISRAKLAYLVDSTAAPVAIIALISTWIGAVLGYIREAESAMEGFDQSAYLMFLNSLPYNFYAFLAIFFVFLIALSGRDFGAMRRAERQALAGNDTTGLAGSFDDVDEPQDASASPANGQGSNEAATQAQEATSPSTRKTSHWSFAAVPIVGLVTVTMVGLWITGEGSGVQEIVGSADSYAALVWGSAFALVSACALTIAGRLLSVEEMFRAMFRGMGLIFEGLVILVLAWSLGKVTQELQTAAYLITLFEGMLNPHYMPALIFVLAAFTSFATGSSWGTMGILMPLVLPLVWSLSGASGLDVAMAESLVYASVSAVLAGAVWGDHCSPISDTTILSSLACQCDHVSHVNTQLPYAVVVGAVSVVLLVLAMVPGLPLWLLYAVAIALLVGIVYRFGKPLASNTRVVNA